MTLFVLKTFIFLLVLCGVGTPGEAQNCETTNETLQKCIKMAEPLIKDSQNVFPSTDAEISHVCNNLFPRTWSDFIACVKKYTDNCLNSDEKTDFNRAVGDSINVVHRLCTNEDYKKDYMTHAFCIRDRATSHEHCGRFYQNLLDKISSVTASPSDICCAHSKFKYCVLKKTEYCQCDDQQTCSPHPLEKSKANTFARATLDKALGFLLKQCDSVGFDDCEPPSSSAQKEPRVISESTDKDTYKDFDGYFPSGGRFSSSSTPPPQPQTTTTLFSPSLIDDNYVLDSSTIASFASTSQGPSSTPYSYDDMSPPSQPRFPLERERSRPTPWTSSSQEDIQDFDDLFGGANDVFQYQLSPQELEQNGSSAGRMNPEALPTTAFIVSLYMMFNVLFRI